MEETNEMNTETTYICSGFRSVKAESNQEAALIFANREAHKRYGRTAYCLGVNASSWSQDGSLVEYGCFIGYTPRGQRNTTVGNDYRFVVQS